MFQLTFNKKASRVLCKMMPNVVAFTEID